MPTQRKISVLVIDAQPVSRVGFCALVRSHAGLRLVGEAECVRSGREAAVRLKPDLIVLDVGMPGGVVAMRDLRRVSRRSELVVVSGVVDALGVQRALRAGVRGYVSRWDAAEAVLAGLVRAAGGVRWLGPRVEEVLLERISSGAVEVGEDDLALLSPRELEVFRLIGEGRSTRAIAEALGVSGKTVETHRERLKGKLKLRDGAALVRRAMLAAG